MSLKKADLEISEEFKRIEDDFSTGDQHFSLVEILELVLPDGSKIDCLPNDSKLTKQEQREWMMGFSISLSENVICFDNVDDWDDMVEWMMETLKRFLDLQGRYSCRDSGPLYLDAICAPSLTFDWRIQYMEDDKKEIWVQYFLDDSTR